MIEANGYKAFHGVMMIISTVRDEPYQVEADWIYTPDTDSWHANGSFYPASFCQLISETTKTCKHNYIEKQVEKGVTVQVLECADCGEVSVGWYREE